MIAYLIITDSLHDVFSTSFKNLNNTKYILWLKKFTNIDNESSS